MTTNSTMIKVSPKTLRKHALNCIQSQTPYFVWGNPGIGKSRILQALVERMGFHFEDIRLSQIESVDLRGLPAKEQKDELIPVFDKNGEKVMVPALDKDGKPVFNKEYVDGKEVNTPVMVQKFDRKSETNVVWAMPDFLRRAREQMEKYGKPTAFFFDELNSGSPATMAAAYQFINDRRIGSFELGAKDVVFAAGNLESDGGVTNSMPLPLANRFRHYLMDVNTEQWLNFASEVGMHPYVLAYLSIGSNGSKLQNFNVDQLLSSDEKAFATPRSWEMLSKALYAAYGDYQPAVVNKTLAEESDEFNVHDDDDRITENDISVIAASCVGSGIAVEFAGFVKEGMDLPKAREILDGKTKTVTGLKTKTSAQYFIANDCSHALKEMKAKLEEVKKESGDKSSEYDKVLKSYVKSMENYILFAKENFARELFVFGIITVMLKRYKVMPMPNHMDKKVFDLVATEFNAARLKN